MNDEEWEMKVLFLKANYIENLYFFVILPTLTACHTIQLVI